MPFSKIIDRHLAWIVLKFTFVGQLSFFLIYVFIDLLDKAFKLKAEEGASQILLLVRYYLAQLPPLFETTSPFILALASVIALSRFQHNSQIVAFNAAGQSTSRMLSAVFQLAMVLGVLTFVVQEWITPRSIHESLVITEGMESNRALNLSFQDHITFKEDPTAGWTAVRIDIESLDLDTRAGEGFHATLVDAQGKPTKKIYATEFQYLRDGSLELKESKVLPYEEGALFQSPPSLVCRIRIPLEKVVLASQNLKSLGMMDLRYFTSDPEARVEMYFRILLSLNPLLMCLVSAVLAVPLIFKRAVYAYFACLGSCFGVFFASSFLRSETVAMELHPAWPILGIPLLCMGIYAFFHRRIPT